MKVYYSKPTEDVRIVKPDSDTPYYEFYIMKPIYVGSARGEGSGRVVSDDGNHFTNLRSAIRHLLDGMGERDLADQQELFVHKRQQTVAITGMDVVMQGKWAAFCEHLKLNAQDKSLMDQTYNIPKTEATKLGLAT